MFREALVDICFIDESGDSGILPSATAPIQPVFVLGALVLDASLVKSVTAEFLGVKRRFFPGLHNPSKPLDILMQVVKGCDLRRNVRTGGRNKIRQALLFLGQVFDILERHQARVFARVWVKGIAAPVNERSLYTFSMQSLCATFQSHLASRAREGLIIADSRNKAKNSNVSYSIFTRKYKQAGDEYPNIVEMPTFGHDENHVGLQLADYICSAIICPMAIQSYCSGLLRNIHVSPNYESIKVMFGARLKAMQYRHCDNGKWRGGVTVCDGLAGRPGSAIF